MKPPLYRLSEAPVKTVNSCWGWEASQNQGLQILPLCAAHELVTGASEVSVTYSLEWAQVLGTQSTHRGSSAV